MGRAFPREAFASDADPPLSIHIVGTSAVARVEVIRNEEVVYATQPGTREVRLEYTDSDPPEGESYYYVRVLQDEREIAWGSPI